MSHYKHGSFKRHERVGQELLEVLARWLLVDADDPRLQQVQFTAVHITPDLSRAKVYYVLLDQREADPAAQTALERAEGRVKHEISEVMDLRIVPSLKFLYDESVERGRRMDELLESLDIKPADEDD